MQENNELAIARKEAVSFTGLEPPENAKYIGTERMKNDSYDYFKTQGGKYYYQSDGTRLIEEERCLKEKQKRRVAR